jgi:hypothetical protein
MAGAHARIAPSGLALTVACHASVQLQEAAGEQPETDEEAEGTAADLVAQAYAAGDPWPIGHKFESSGRQWAVDVDMVNGAKLFVETLRGEGGDVRLHDGVRCSAIHETDCWGTPDGWRFFPRGTGPQQTPVLRAVEYKYGFRYVEVFECWQLIAYAVGVIERLQLDDQNLILELVVVQPRSYTIEGKVRTWRVSATDIRALVNIAEHAAHEALKPNPTATTGAHCIDCKARHLCTTLQRSAANLVDYSAQADANELSADAMGSELHILDQAMQRLEARRTGLAIRAEAALRAGVQVPFYELKPGRSNLKWLETVKPEDIAALGDILGVTVRKPLEVFTPRQCIDAGIGEDLINNYASRPAAGLKLAPVSMTATRKMFGANRT